MAKFTWTGKGKNNKKTKEIFSKLNFINELVVTTLKKIDSSYSIDIFKNDMAKHICKNAFRHESCKNE